MRIWSLLAVASSLLIGIAQSQESGPGRIAGQSKSDTKNEQRKSEEDKCGTKDFPDVVAITPSSIAR